MFTLLVFNSIFFIIYGVVTLSDGRGAVTNFQMSV